MRSLESCLYEGWVRHRRFAPIEHEFRFALFMVYLDLSELPIVFDRRWLWSTRRVALARFRREDYLGDPRMSLDRAVRERVEERTGRRPDGPIRLLTHLRYFGYGFNPVSLYYCFDREGKRVDSLVVEVSNTPWQERHCYVLRPHPTREGSEVLHERSPKRFHVSPFMEMDLTYDWRLRTPGRRLSVQIENHKEGVPVFDATLVLRRREITGRSLARALVRYPAMTAQVIASIYFQAMRLRRKKAAVFPHPQRPPDASVEASAT